MTKKSSVHDLRMKALIAVASGLVQGAILLAAAEIKRRAELKK